MLDGKEREIGTSLWTLLLGSALFYRVSSIQTELAYLIRAADRVVPNLKGKIAGLGFTLSRRKGQEIGFCFFVVEKVKQDALLEPMKKEGT